MKRTKSSVSQKKFLKNGHAVFYVRGGIKGNFMIQVYKTKLNLRTQ